MMMMMMMMNEFLLRLTWNRSWRLVLRLQGCGLVLYGLWWLV